MDLKFFKTIKYKLYIILYLECGKKRNYLLKFLLEISRDLCGREFCRGRIKECINWDKGFGKKYKQPDLMERANLLEVYLEKMPLFGYCKLSHLSSYPEIKNQLINNGLRPFARDLNDQRNKNI